MFDHLFLKSLKICHQRPVAQHLRNSPIDNLSNFGDHAWLRYSKMAEILAADF